MMEAMAAAHDIERVIRFELDYCKATIDRDDMQRAKSELDQAAIKLKAIAARVHRLQSKLPG